MYYNLELFGRRIRKLRNKLELTQKDISDLTNLSTDTLRKIENGKVTPNLDTLELLSVVLKQDINKLLLNYRLRNFSTYIEIEERIEYKIENGLYSNFQEDLDGLNSILMDININSYIYNKIQQLKLLVESIELKTKYRNYSESLAKLIDAIVITTPIFNLSNYRNHVYNRMEIRILMNIALNINLINSKEKGLEILLFCLSAVDESDIEFRIKILYNLAYNFHRLDLNEKALYYADKGVKTCISNNSLYCLGLLYSRKGIAEYFLGDKVYKHTLEKAIAIYELTNQMELKNMLINACDKHNIQLLDI